MKPELGGGREGNGASEKIQASETVPKPDNITPLEIIYGRSVWAKNTLFPVWRHMEEEVILS